MKEVAKKFWVGLAATLTFALVVTFVYGFAMSLIYLAESLDFRVILFRMVAILSSVFAVGMFGVAMYHVGDLVMMNTARQ